MSENYPNLYGAEKILTVGRLSCSMVILANSVLFFHMANHYSKIPKTTNRFVSIFLIFISIFMLITSLFEYNFWTKHYIEKSKKTNPFFSKSVQIENYQYILISFLFIFIAFYIAYVIYVY
jgi:hypothetical protein